MNSIGTLMSSTNSNDIKISCCKLIGLIAKSGKIVQETVISLVANMKDQNLAQHTIALIATKSKCL